MNKKAYTYRLAILGILILAVCVCIVMATQLKSNHEKIGLLESRLDGYQNLKKELNGFNAALQKSLDEAGETNKSLKVQLEESEHYGDYQGNDDFSDMITNNPIDQDYKKELKQLQESDDTITTLAWGAFESKYLAIWQKEMDATLKVLTSLLDKEDAINLEQSQKSWQAYIDEDNAFVVNKFLLDQTFSTQGEVQFVAAQSKRTRERTIKLMEYVFSIDREAVDFVYDD